MFCHMFGLVLGMYITTIFTSMGAAFLEFCCCCGSLLYGFWFSACFGFVPSALVLYNFFMNWVLYCLKLSRISVWDLCTLTLLAHANNLLLVSYFVPFNAVSSLIISSVIPSLFSPCVNCSYKHKSVSLYLHSVAFILSVPHPLLCCSNRLPS